MGTKRELRRATLLWVVYVATEERGHYAPHSAHHDAPAARRQAAALLPGPRVIVRPHIGPLSSVPDEYVLVLEEMGVDLPAEDYSAVTTPP